MGNEKIKDGLQFPYDLTLPYGLFRINFKHYTTNYYLSLLHYFITRLIILNRKVFFRHHFN